MNTKTTKRITVFQSVMSPLFLAICIIVTVAPEAVSDTASHVLMRVAIVADSDSSRAFGPLISLLEEKLSNTSNLEIVERGDTLSKLFHERERLALFNSASTALRSKLGAILKADLLVLIRSVDYGSKKKLRIAVSDTSSGIRIWRTLLTIDNEKIEEQTEQIVDDIKNIACARYRNRANLVIVAVPPFESKNVIVKYDYLQDELADIITIGLMGNPKVVTVDLEEANAILDELSIAGNGNAIIKRRLPIYVNGEFQNSFKNGKTIISMHVTLTRGLKKIKEKNFSGGNIINVMKDIANFVVDAVAFRPHHTTLLFESKQEISELKQRAESFATVGYRDKARRLYETILLLNPKDVDTVEYLLRDYISYIDTRYDFLNMKETETTLKRNIQMLKKALTCAESLVRLGRFDYIEKNIFLNISVPIVLEETSEGWIVYLNRDMSNYSTRSLFGSILQGFQLIRRNKKNGNLLKILTTLSKKFENESASVKRRQCALLLRLFRRCVENGREPSMLADCFSDIMRDCRVPRKEKERWFFKYMDIASHGNHKRSYMGYGYACAIIPITIFQIFPNLLLEKGESSWKGRFLRKLRKEYGEYGSTAFDALYILRFLSHHSVRMAELTGMSSSKKRMSYLKRLRETVMLIDRVEDTKYGMEYIHMYDFDGWRKKLRKDIAFLSGQSKKLDIVVSPTRHAHSLLGESLASVKPIKHAPDIKDWIMTPNFDILIRFNRIELLGNDGVFRTVYTQPGLPDSSVRIDFLCFDGRYVWICPRRLQTIIVFDTEMERVLKITESNGLPIYGFCNIRVTPRSGGKGKVWMLVSSRTYSNGERLRRKWLGKVTVKENGMIDCEAAAVSRTDKENPRFWKKRIAVFASPFKPKNSDIPIWSNKNVIGYLRQMRSGGRLGRSISNANDEHKYEILNAYGEKIKNPKTRQALSVFLQDMRLNAYRIGDLYHFTYSGIWKVLDAKTGLVRSMKLDKHAPRELSCNFEFNAKNFRTSKSHGLILLKHGKAYQILLKNSDGNNGVRKPQ